MTHLEWFNYQTNLAKQGILFEFKRCDKHPTEPLRCDICDEIEQLKGFIQRQQETLALYDKKIDKELAELRYHSKYLSENIEHKKNFLS